MLAAYAPLLVLAALAIGLGLIVLAIAVILGPRDSSPVKRQSYESGMTALGDAQRRIPVRFYLIATLFIIFDIEVIYLYPWAVNFKALVAEQGWAALASMGLFLGVLMLGFVHVWRKGALNWD